MPKGGDGSADRVALGVSFTCTLSRYCLPLDDRKWDPEPANRRGINSNRVEFVKEGNGDETGNDIGQCFGPSTACLGSCNQARECCLADVSSRGVLRILSGSGVASGSRGVEVGGDYFATCERVADPVQGARMAANNNVAQPSLHLSGCGKEMRRRKLSEGGVDGVVLSVCIRVIALLLVAQRLAMRFKPARRRTMNGRER